jgi:FKBP12-rapamycin complex-associated protein
MSSSTLEEYYPAIAIATLMRIIRDPTLSQHHTMVVQVISVDIGFVGFAEYISLLYKIQIFPCSFSVLSWG